MLMSLRIVYIPTGRFVDTVFPGRPSDGLTTECVGERPTGQGGPGARDVGVGVGQGRVRGQGPQRPRLRRATSSL